MTREELLAQLEDERDRPVPRPDRAVAVDRLDVAALLYELFALRAAADRFAAAQNVHRLPVPGHVRQATDRIAHAAGLLIPTRRDAILNYLSAQDVAARRRTARHTGRPADASRQTEDHDQWDGAAGNSERAPRTRRA